MTFKIDKTDEQLITLLQDNAYRSSDEIAKQLFISPTTVRRRMKRLMNADVLRIVALADSEKLGVPFGLVIGLKVVANKLQTILDSLDKRKEIMWLAGTTGRFDIVAFAHFHSTDELSRFIQVNINNTEGVLASETLVCLQVRKGRYRHI